MSARPDHVPQDLRNPCCSTGEGRVLYEATFCATPLAVRAQIDSIIRTLRTHSCDQDLQSSIEISIAELLNNIVEHGYAATDIGQIALRIECIDHRLHILTEDSGNPLPELSVPDPKAPDLDVDLSEMPEGQFGWFMIQKLTNVVEYRRKNGKNHFSIEIL